MHLIDLQHRFEQSIDYAGDNSSGIPEYNLSIFRPIDGGAARERYIVQEGILADIRDGAKQLMEAIDNFLKR